MIRTENLTKRFGKVTAVEGLSLDIREGEKAELEWGRAEVQEETDVWKNSAGNWTIPSIRVSKTKFEQLLTRMQQISVYST
ncbi:MAG: hypothetical protein Q8N46_09880 [Anaerolineales bacterium]|nr:hypothetical protein [Anaerolineales bacterium]